MIRRRTAAAVVLCATFALSAAHASANETPPADGYLIDTRGFVSARFASASSWTLYAAEGWGRAGVFFGAVENPRTGYRELLAGSFRRWVWRDRTLMAGLALADATESDYAQLYLVPTVTRGRLEATATFVVVEPLERDGTRQLGMNPLNLLWQVASRWRAGASLVSSVGEGAPPSHRAGPALELALARGTVRVELLGEIAHAESELRLGYQKSF